MNNFALAIIKSTGVTGPTAMMSQAAIVAGAGLTTVGASGTVVPDAAIAMRRCSRCSTSSPIRLQRR
jgi:hypothetical protein